MLLIELVASSVVSTVVAIELVASAVVLPVGNNEQKKRTSHFATLKI